jgi:hypothetical protein
MTAVSSLSPAVAFTWSRLGLPVTWSTGNWATVVVFAWLFLVILASGRSKERRRRLDLIEQALRNPSLTPQAQQELVKALTPAQPRRLLFSIGWLGMFSGIAWLCTSPRGDDFNFAIATTVVSVALLSLPIALRELEARKA